MKEKRKQIIINIITIINVIVIIFWIYRLYINNKYSLSYIYELAEKANQYNNNYIMEIEELNITGEETKEIITRKENVCKIETYDNITEEYHLGWRTNKAIILQDKEKDVLYYIKNDTELDKDPQVGTIQEKMWWGEYYTEDSRCKFVKKEKYNNTECIVLKFTADNLTEKVWVNEEYGFILKVEVYQENQLIQIVKYKIQVDHVTDEMLDLPNIEDCRKIGNESA